MRKSCNKTHFLYDLCSLQLFPRFLVVFCDERGSWERVGNTRKTQKGYCSLARLGRDRGFLYSDRAFWLCVATGFGLGKVFSGRDRVCSLS